MSEGSEQDHGRRSGMCPDQAIVILAEDTFGGIDREYTLLDEMFGVPGEGWMVCRQSLLNDGSHILDRIDVRLADGQMASVYFDVTSFFGR